MTTRPLPDVLGRRLRLNPAFRAVSIDRLTANELLALGGVYGDSDLEAVLIPNRPPFSAKAIGGSTARFINSLGAPDQPLGDSTPPDNLLLIRLILDSVVEMEHDGHFVSGGAAAERLSLAPVDPATDLSALSRLSREAVAYGESTGITDPVALSARLYFYNRVPISPRWTERIGTPDALASWLGFDSGIRWQALNLEWLETPPRLRSPVWRHFRADGLVHAARFKLYISPRAEFLRETLEATIPVLADCGFRAFKVGRDLAGILRPDKFVAYAHSRQQIESASGALLAKLRGVPAHAVPFTTAIDEDGLLSWGMDPPPSEQVSAWQGASWRRWITDRLAVALITGRASGSSSASRFAFQRLAVEGVDVESWTPTDVAWAQLVAR